MLFVQLFLNMFGGMANSIDGHDQKQSDLGLHFLHMPLWQELKCMKF